MLRRRHKKNKSGFSRKIVPLIILILFILGLSLFFKSNFLKVQFVDVSLNNAGCSDEKGVIDKSNLLGQNIFFIDQKKLSENIKQSFVCIKSVNLSKSLPSRVKLDVLGRNPTARFYSVKTFDASASALIESMATSSASQVGDVYLVDEEGVIFAKDTTAQDLPKVTIFGLDLSIGMDFTDSLKKTLRILEELKHLGIENKETYIFNDFLITTSYPKVVFNLSRDIDIQIASLQLIVQKAKINSEVLEFIDLRFDKPLIKFAPKKK